MEKDDEVNGVTGSSYDFGARQYDSRLGRWLSRDPLAAKYSSLSPYTFVANSPLVHIDPDGERIAYVIKQREGKKPLLVIVIRAKVLNMSGQAVDDKFVRRSIGKHLTETLQSENISIDENSDYNPKDYEIKTVVDIQTVNSIEEVGDDDHLIILTTVKTGKVSTGFDKNNNPTTGTPTGIAPRIGGLVTWVDVDKFQGEADKNSEVGANTVLHELIKHLFLAEKDWGGQFDYNVGDKKGTVTRQGTDGFKVSDNILRKIIRNIKTKAVNKGRNKHISLGGKTVPGTSIEDNNFIKKAGGFETE